MHAPPPVQTCAIPSESGYHANTTSHAHVRYTSGSTMHITGRDVTVTQRRHRPEDGCEHREFGVRVLDCLEADCLIPLLTRNRRAMRCPQLVDQLLHPVEQVAVVWRYNAEVGGSTRPRSGSGPFLLEVRIVEHRRVSGAG